MANFLTCSAQSTDRDAIVMCHPDYAGLRMLPGLIYNGCQLEFADILMLEN